MATLAVARVMANPTPDLEARVDELTTRFPRGDAGH
jgi:hypothetical protein